MGLTSHRRAARFAVFGAVVALFWAAAPLHAKAPDAGARANWQAITAELAKDQPNPEVFKTLTHKSVFLRGALTERSGAGLRVKTDTGVICEVLNPMRLDTKGREEVTVTVLGRVQSVDMLRRTVNVKATSVDVVP